MYDIILQAIKFTGILWGGAFGVLGLLTEFRHPDTKKVTRTGKIALTGIVVSALFAVVAQVVEYISAQEAQRKQLQRLAEQVEKQDQTLDGIRNTITQIDRQQHSIIGQPVAVVLQFSEDDPIAKTPAIMELLSVFAEVGNEIRDKPRAAQSSQAHPDVFATKNAEKDFLIMDIDVRARSFPSGLLPMFGRLAIYDAAIQLQDAFTSRSGPSLNLELSTDQPVSGRLRYNPKERVFLLGLTVNANRESTTGKIIGISDIPDKHIYLSFLDGSIGRPVAQIDHLSMRVSRITFHAVSGRTFDIDGQEIEFIGKSYPEVTVYCRSPKA